MSKKLPDISAVKELLDYDSSTGELRWKVRRNQLAQVNSLAGHIADCRGKKYYRVRIRDALIMGHWIAWAIHYGEWLTTGIDHIDGDGLNNAITNLRSAPQAVNNKNASIRKDNKTGHSGVTIRGNRFIPNIRVDGKQYWLGSYETIEEAVRVRKEALTKHGFHANHGRMALSEIRHDQQA